MDRQAEVNEFYAKLLAETGRLHKNDVSNELRYASLRRQINFHKDMTVLEIGCGTGDFLFDLIARGIRVQRYIGIDPLKEAIDVFDKRVADLWPPFPVHTGCVQNYLQWLRGGDLKFALNTPIDCVICLGVFDIRLGDTPQEHRDVCQKYVDKMYEDSRHIVAATFMGRGGWKDRTMPDHCGPVHEVDAYQMFHNNGKAVLLDNSYAPHIYTVFGWKGETLWEQKNREPAGPNGGGTGTGSSAGKT
jgi:SAM-dependent methyltransferase